MSENEVHTPSRCEMVRENFSAFLDAELDVEDRSIVEKHLHECSDCLRELHGFKLVNDLYATLPTVRAPEDFEKNIMAALKPRIRPFRHFVQHWKFAVSSAALLLFVISLGFTWMLWKAENDSIASLDYMAREMPVSDMFHLPMLSPPIEAWPDPQDVVVPMEAEIVNDDGDHTPAMGLMMMGADRPDSMERENGADLEHIESLNQTGEFLFSQPIGIDTIVDKDDAVAAGGGIGVALPQRKVTGGIGGFGGAGGGAGGGGPNGILNDLSEQDTMGGYGGGFAMGGIAMDSDQPIVEYDTTKEIIGTRRTLASRVFLFDDGLWTEQHDVKPEAYIEISFGDDIHVKLLQADAELAELARLSGEVLFYHDGEWYLLRLQPPQNQLSPE